MRASLPPGVAGVCDYHTRSGPFSLMQALETIAALFMHFLRVNGIITFDRLKTLDAHYSLSRVSATLVRSGFERAKGFP